MSSGKVIIASSRHAKAVRELNLYMRVKGSFMRIKQDPAHPLEPNELEEIFQFLETKTELPNQPFWSGMLKEQKIKACRLFVIKECRSFDTDNQLVYTTLNRKPEIFISLNGDISVVRLSLNIYHHFMII